MKISGGVAAVLTAAAIVMAASGCSSGTTDGRALCSALDGGMVPGVALGALPQAQTDPVAAMSRARDLIRSECPQHEPAAVAYDTYLAPPAPVVAPPAAPAAVAPTTTTRPTSTSKPRATTTAPVRPKTRDAADAESDRLKSCMVKTGQTEAQCRGGRGESKAVTDSRAVGGGLAACIDQTGMTEAQCRAASARGEGG
ncbi:hypothetical protein GCM10023201_40630 [Actinomycetospora corticicola]|uniref:Secreted protein n=1 Tax=Actinomycetospora corticicola TaxID=663602 RepID=A0A7Y9DWJ9_9PSEU|nr:hypothetical protein [Actinomycetospora corticicola]NYD36853.1 hypothetical protein [Actinomycetospora corticicola]